jgi:hypothetical protein
MTREQAALELTDDAHGHGWSAHPSTQGRAMPDSAEGSLPLITEGHRPRTERTPNEPDGQGRSQKGRRAGPGAPSVLSVLSSWARRVPDRWAVGLLWALIIFVFIGALVAAIWWLPSLLTRQPSAHVTGGPYWWNGHGR